MLYVFCGDRFTARETSRQFADACKKKRPEAEYIFLSLGNTPFLLEELLVGTGLFERKYIVFCDQLLEESFSEHLLSHFEEYHQSPHMFILFEPDLSVADEKKIKKAGGVVQRSEVLKKPVRSSTVFLFTDAFLQHNTLRAFSLFHSLLLKGESATSLLQLLVWQVRTLTLVAFSKSAEEAKIKPFVYMKTQKALSHFPDPFMILATVESSVRNGRLQGLSEEEIVESILFTTLEVKKC